MVLDVSICFNQNICLASARKDLFLCSSIVLWYRMELCTYREQRTKEKMKSNIRTWKERDEEEKAFSLRFFSLSL